MGLLHLSVPRVEKLCQIQCCPCSHSLRMQMLTPSLLLPSCCPLCLPHTFHHPSAACSLLPTAHTPLPLESAIASQLTGLQAVLESVFISSDHCPQAP